MYSKLSEIQKRFVDEYIIDLNATDSYRRAGYKAKNDNVASASANKLLRLPKVKKAIDERREAQTKRLELSADKVLQELSSIAFSDVTQFVNIETVTEMDHALGREVTYQKVSLNDTKELTPEQRKIIDSIKQGRNGIELKLYDKMKALELLGKHLKLWTEKVEQETTGNFQVNFNIPRPTYQKPKDKK